MALAFANFKRKPPQDGGWRSGYVDITLDGSYPTGGWAITASNLNLGTLYNIFTPSNGIGSNDLGYVARWDHVAGKLLMFEGNASGGVGMQEPAGADVAAMSGEVLRCFYEGS